MGDIFAAVVDIETTGLDARSDVPLEIGVALVDKEGGIKDYCEWLIYEKTPKYTQAIARAKEHEIVGPMHDMSGLWLELSNPFNATRAQVDEELCEFLTKNEVRFGTIPMMGSSIGSLDRPFVLEHFPEFNLALSYRNIDISSVKELCKAHNPTLYAKIKKYLDVQWDEDEGHRVRSDIAGCLREYREYVDSFLFTEEGE